MIRKIIHIEQEKCCGCGLCAKACNEGAIQMVNGKAKLVRDDYCDGLGNCLPVCPTDAISFVEREAAEFDKTAVTAHKKKQEVLSKLLPCGCPGSNAKPITRPKDNEVESTNTSRLNQWPVQIKLVPAKASYFDNANLLIAADCAAYAYGNFHNEFIKNRVTLIGCTKLDNIDYTTKLTDIIKNNNIKSVTIVTMEVPCCRGLEIAAKNALQQSGKFLPWQIVTISTDGRILD